MSADSVPPAPPTLPVMVRVPPGPVLVSSEEESPPQTALVVVDPVRRSVGLAVFATSDYPVPLWNLCKLGIDVPPGASGEALTRALESEPGQQLLTNLLGSYLGETTDREGICHGQWAPGVRSCVDALEEFLRQGRRGESSRSG